MSTVSQIFIVVFADDAFISATPPRQSSKQANRSKYALHVTVQCAPHTCAGLRPAGGQYGTVADFRSGVCLSTQGQGAFSRSVLS